MKQSISQIKKSLQKKTISVEELHDEFLNKAKENANNSYNLILDKEYNKQKEEYNRIINAKKQFIIEQANKKIQEQKEVKEKE